MSAEINWTEIGKLAKGFKDAVDARVKEGPAAIPVEQAKELLGDKATDEKVNQMVENSKWLAFILAATPDELFGMLGASAGTDKNGKPSGKIAPPLENFILVAEIYARLAERKGLSDEFKGLVPAEAKTEKTRAALAEKAPAFAKLCV
tara:strand:+ start:523 stop:966 length:444 start_codon:yes stop_codon:yes gene_type:complete